MQIWIRKERGKMSRIEDSFPYLETCKEIDTLGFFKDSPFVWGYTRLSGDIVIGERGLWLDLEDEMRDLIICSAPTVSEMLEIICKSTKVKIGYLPVSGNYNSEKHTMEIVNIPQWIVGPPEEEFDPHITEDTPFLAESVGQFLLQVAYSKVGELGRKKEKEKDSD
jgi:hypothetical protein